MTREHPPVCYFIGLSLVLYLLVILLVMILIHVGTLTFFEGHAFLRLHVMAGLFGALGATISAMRKYYHALITTSTARVTGKQHVPVDWTFGWIYYYLTRPLLGGILGALSFTLTYVGFNILKGPTPTQISGQGQHLIYALALLAGFSVSHTLDRLDALARELFRASSDRESPS